MDTETETRPRTVGDGTTNIGGRVYMEDAKGALVPIDLVKPQHALEDQTVRKVMDYAVELREQLRRFRGHCFDDIGSFQELLSEKYGATRGGAKGNVTLTSYDGTMKVVVQVQDQLTFGPELQAAKEIVDECIDEWAENSRDEIRALVNHAFQVDKEGRINRSALFQLRRIEIVDERWKRAMEALTESIRIVGSSTYVRFYMRDDPRGRWEAVSIDLASA